MNLIVLHIWIKQNINRTYNNDLQDLEENRILLVDYFRI